MSTIIQQTTQPPSRRAPQALRERPRTPSPMMVPQMPRTDIHELHHNCSKVPILRHSGLPLTSISRLTPLFNKATPRPLRTRQLVGVLASTPRSLPKRRLLPSRGQALRTTSISCSKSSDRQTRDKTRRGQQQTIPLRTLTT